MWCCMPGWRQSYQPSSTHCQWRSSCRALTIAWERWQAGLTVKPTLSDKLPPLRLLLIMDNLAGHLTARFVVWLFEHGIMPLYTPLSGSWLNMTESIQRILAGRALAGQTPANSAELIDRLETTARAWNGDPTPFEWGGKRQLR